MQVESLIFMYFNFCFVSAFALLLPYALETFTFILYFSFIYPIIYPISNRITIGYI